MQDALVYALDPSQINTTRDVDHWD